MSILKTGFFSSPYMPASQAELLQALHDSSQEIKLEDPNHVGIFEALQGELTTAIADVCGKPDARWKDVEHLRKKVTPEGLQTQLMKAVKGQKNEANRTQYLNRLSGG